MGGMVQGLSLGDYHILQGEHPNGGSTFSHLFHLQLVLPILNSSRPRSRDQDGLHVHLEVTTRFAEERDETGDCLLGRRRGTSGL